MSLQSKATSPVVIPDQPNPAYRYLRVEAEGRPPALLVLAFLDPGPMGEVEVWFSAQREVLRIVAGRIVGTSGMELDWRAVRYRGRLPAWNSNFPPETLLERSRDVMPGYHFGIRETLALTRVDAAPPGVHPVRLPSAVTWYVERVVAPAPSELPAAIYALTRSAGQNTLVYSRQCLSAGLCLNLQPWPVPAVDP